MMKRLALAGSLALASILALAASPAQAACSVTNSYPFKDALFRPQSFASIVLPDPDCRVIPLSILTDPAGTPYSGIYGVPVAQQGVWTFGLTGPIPAGSNAIGHVTVDGTLPVVPATGVPSDAAVTQQALTGLSVLGTRAAEPASLGEWSVQNQSASVMYLVFYASDGVTRLGTLAIDPGAGQGRQGGDQSYLQTFGPFKGPMTLFGTAGAQAMLTRQ